MAALFLKQRRLSLVSLLQGESGKIVPGNITPDMIPTTIIPAAMIPSGRILMTIKRTGQNFLTVFGILAVSALALAACRAEEQGRITKYKPGIYLGKPDTKLSSEQVRRLSLRASMQGNPVYRASGGGSVRKPDVREPVGVRGKKQGNP